MSVSWRLITFFLFSHFTFIDISERYMFNWRLKHHKGQTVFSKIHMISLHARCNIALL